MLKIEENLILAIDIPAKSNNDLLSGDKNYKEGSIIAKAYNERSKKKTEEREIQQIFHIITCGKIMIKGNHIQMFLDLVNEKSNDIELMGLDKHQFLRNVRREMKIFRKYTKQNNDMILQNLPWFCERLFDIYANSNPYKNKAITLPKPFTKFHSPSSSEVVPRKLEFEESGEDTPNIISNIVTIYHGIVTYSPYLMTLRCNTTDGRSNTVHCPSPITDITRIGKETVLVTLPFRQKLLIINPSSCEMKSLDYGFYKISYLNHCKFVGLELFSKTIYLVDWANDTVEKITALEEQPTDIIVGPQHHLLLAFANINKVICCSLGGRQLFQVYTQSTVIPTSISAYRNYFYVLQGNVIYRISSKGGVSQRKIAIKAQYICCGTNSIFLLDYLGIAYTFKTNDNFWPSMTYRQQAHTPTVKNQIHIDDPCEIQNILPMPASSILLLYRSQEVKLFSDNGQVIHRSTLTSKCQPTAICRTDSNRFLVLYQEDRKLQYIACPELTEGHFIDIDADYIQICHMVSNKYLALTTGGNEVEAHILLITENKIDIVDKISLKHEDVIIAATPINFVVADMRENALVFYSSSGEELFVKQLDFYSNPHHIYTDKLYFYVVFRRESVIVCYNIIGESKWQLKLPSTPYFHIDVFQGTVYVVDVMHSRILLYKYYDWSSCCIQFKNPYIKNLDIRLKENKNNKILIAKMCWLPSGQFVLSNFNNDRLLYVSKEGDIMSTLSLPSLATDICRWDCNQIGVTLPLEKQLWVIGNVSKRVRTLSLSHPYIWVRKLGEGHTACVCDKPSRLDIVSIQNHNQGEIISTINIPFVKSLVIENETQNVLVVTKKKIFLYKPITRRRRRSSSSSSSSSSGSSSSSSSKLVPTLLLPHIRPPPSLYGGYIDNIFVYLIDNSSMFAINDYNLVVSDHITNNQLNMHIDLVDVFSRNICVSEMLSSTLHLEDHTVSDKARHILIPRSVGENEYMDITGFSVITENNLIILYDNANRNIKILTFDGQLLDSIKLNIFPTYMCCWQSNTLVITTGDKYQLLTLKVEFPLSLVTYQTENEYYCIASLSDNLLVCYGYTDGEKYLLIIKIDEIQSTVCERNKIVTGITQILRKSYNNGMCGIAVTAEDVIILISDDYIIFFKRNGELLRMVQHHIYVKENYMTIDDAFLYIYGCWDKENDFQRSRIMCLLQTGKYKRIFLNKRHYKHGINFSSINCNGPRFVGNTENRLYVEGLFEFNRERFSICKLLTDLYPVEVKDLDISFDGQIVVCEKANTGNLKIFQCNGELVYYRDIGTLVGGVCYTEERDIMVTVPYRKEIFQLKQQDLANYKVWQSEIPYGIICRKAENTYWCVHINLTEYYTIEIDGDKLNILECLSLKLDSGLHFPPVTPYMNNEIFSNELINTLKHSKGDGREKSCKIIDKGRLKVRCGNYIAETTLGSNEILVKRMPHRTAMFPLSTPTGIELDYYHYNYQCIKLIMLHDNVAVIIQNPTLIVTNTTGDILHHTVIDKKAQDICRWTDDCFIVLLQEDKQLMFFKRDLSHLKTINITKGYEMICKKNDNQLVCGGYTLDKRSGWKFYYVDVVNILDETCEYSHEVWSGGTELKKICVTSSEDIVIVQKPKWSYVVACWYREGLVWSLEINLNIHDERIHLSAHGEYIYITDLSNNIHQIARDGEQQLFLSSDDSELHTVLGIDISADFFMIFGPVSGLHSYCFLHYER
ncbi:uncharacterized protein LOC106873529 [Octopus bimaculoides]|uniref:Uncharacterized protein n=1 Tax=Octopus bimaculoides TaxID=37653 RepID=A0A0L8H0V4_OCTBM|nr:uncharacterized protein LOC106873529 [Octopus bimaculoides]|eukprot:XP_014776406.1 PREDICTED: uncharacterized protein LOC106873529 [Octopus bimaculoides]